MSDEEGQNPPNDAEPGNDHGPEASARRPSSRDAEAEMLELFGGSAELAALADEDSNELLRFVEGTTTEDESSAFLARLETRDPLAAMRLLRMQEDHRLLRTTGEVVPGRDLLAPVRARFARGELVADSNFAEAGAEPTEFMERSLASMARRRRRGGRRTVVIVAAILAGLAIVLVLGLDRGWFGTRGGGGASSTAANASESSSLAGFALVIPVSDLEEFSRAETLLAMKVVERESVLLRNLDAAEAEALGGQPPPIVGVSTGLANEDLRRSMAGKGFTHLLVTDRDLVPTLLAELGRIAAEDGGGPRLVPSNERLILDRSVDAWESWSDRENAERSIGLVEGPVIVPIALVIERESPE